MNMNFKRGDIVWADFGKNEGSVQNGVRPALVISNDKGNYFSPNLIVVPITSQIKKPMPTHLKIKANNETGLIKNSTALIEQPITISKTQATDIIGHYKMDKMTDIKILISFGCLSFLGSRFQKAVCM